MKKEMKPGDMFNAHVAKMKKHRKNWIQGAIKHPGALHAELGVPAGKKIPAKKLASAAKKPGKEGKRARLAETLKGFHKHRKHSKKRKSVKEYEGSALDNKLDRISGFKEGSKKDEAMDKAIAPHLKKYRKMCAKHHKIHCKKCD